MTDSTNPSGGRDDSIGRPAEEPAAKSPEKPAKPRAQNRIPIFFYVGALAFLLLVIFIVQNTQPVVVSFLIWRAEMSQIVVITISGILGFFLGLVATRGLRRR